MKLLLLFLFAVLFIHWVAASPTSSHQTTGTPTPDYNYRTRRPSTAYNYHNQASAPGINYRICSSNSPFTIRSLQVTPNPLRFGQAATVTVQANSTEEVAGGNVHVSVNGKGPLSFVKYSKDYEICKVFPNGCPIKKGPLSFTITRQIPNVPFAKKIAGSYEIDMKARDNKDQELICVKVDVEIAA